MFFLLRVAFWLTIVLALLPSGGGKSSAGNGIDAGDAVAAAGAAVSDVSGFCDRKPQACEVGAQTAVAIGQRAQAGARMVYDFISDHALRSANRHSLRGTTGSVAATKVAATRPASPGSQGTLKPTDLDPDWRGPIRAENVPLPRPRPRSDSERKA